jgi:Fe-S oxidoreductase
MVTTAERKAHELSSMLERHVEDGRDVVVVEPSDLAMLRDDYEKLVDETTAATVREHSYEIMEYVYGLFDNRDAGDPDPSEVLAASTDDRPVAYHSHCQQRTLGLERYTTAVLETLGYEVVTSDVECCGMAGSFGYKTQFYDLSLDVAEPLRDQFESPALRESTVVTSGVSCSEQLEGELDRGTVHPIELIDPSGRI